MIEVKNETIERVSLLLADVKNGVKTVFHNAINRGLDTIRSETSKQIRKVYHITDKDLRKETNIYLQKIIKNSLVGEIKFAGCKIPLYRFNTTPKTVGKKRIVKAAQLRSNTATPFLRAFIAKMQSGHIGMFERVRKSRTPIKEFMGASVAQMAGNSVVLDRIEKAAEETINKRINHEVNRILQGI